MGERLPITSTVLDDRRRSLVGWTIALTGVCVMYVGLYPSFEDTDVEAMIDAMPQALVDALGYDQIGTAGGYLDSAIFSLLAFVLLTIVAITFGARVIAGNEEDATLELELASPLPRRRIYLERLLALVVLLAGLTTVVFVVVAILVVALSLDVGLGALAGVSLGLWLVVATFGTIALAAGAATGRRAVGIGAGAGVAVGSWMLDALGPMVGADWMGAISPVAWYSSGVPLLDGIDWAGYVLLVLLMVGSAITGLAAFERRDLLV